MVDDQGRNWFDCPGTNCPDPNLFYMQYRVTMKMDSLYTGRLTALSQVTIHYQGGSNVYLPLVVRKFRR
jgi:hypothetical protein